VEHVGIVCTIIKLIIISVQVECLKSKSRRNQDNMQLLPNRVMQL
jgi:hypothetical protein